MKIRFVILCLIGTTAKLACQSFFWNVSVGNSLKYDYTNTQVRNIALKDNNILKITSGRNKLVNLGWDNVNIGISLNKIVKNKHVFELKFLNDNFYDFLKITSSKGDLIFTNETNLGGSELTSGYGVYNFSLRYHYLVPLSQEKMARQSVKIQPSFFISGDIITPSINAARAPSGSKFSFDFDLGYTSQSGSNISLNSPITNRNRVSYRPCAGITLKVLTKQNKPLLNLQTYFGFNTLKPLAYAQIIVKEDGVLIHEEKYGLSFSAWYFCISRDLYFKRRKK